MYWAQKSKVVTIVSLLTLIVSVIAAIGWIFNIEGIETLSAQDSYIKFNAILCFILFGSAVILTQLQETKFTKLVYLVLSLSLILIALLTFSQYIFHYSAGIDELFVPDRLAKLYHPQFPGRMVPQVSFCFGLLGIALFGFSTKNPRINNLSQYLLHLVTVYTVGAVISYIYNFSFFDIRHQEDIIVLLVALLFFLNSIVATLLHPSIGVTRLFIGGLVGNKMARRLFILMVFVILVFGAFKEHSMGIKLFAFDTNFSLLTVGLLLVSLAIIWNTATWLNKIDKKRYEAEEEVKVMNDELEQRVEERSAELYTLLERYRESESKLTAAFEFSAVGMALVSLDGQWIKVNKRLCEMVGYTEGELLATSFLGITHPEDVDIHLDPIQKALSSDGQALRIEKRYLHKNGHTVWVSINFAVIRDYKNAPMYLVSQVEDITERKNAEAAQKLIIENEERLRAIFDNVEGATSLMDTETRLIVFNNVFKKKQTMLTGKVPEVGDELYYYLPPDEKKQRLEIINRVLKGNKEAFDVSYVKNERPLYYRVSFAPVMVDGRVTAISSYSIDLTASREAEIAIRKSEEKYRSLIEHASDAIYVLDYEGNFTDANDSMCKMTGYTREELLQLNIDQLIDPEQLKAEPLLLGSSLPDKPVTRDRRLVHKDGHLFEVEANVKKFPDQKILVIARDITDRKRMEKELREAELKFRTLAEKSMVGVYISQEQKFIYVNPRFAEIFGYEQHELINTSGSAVELIVSEQDRESVWQNVQARYRGEIENVHYEITGKRKDGTLNHVEFYGSRVIIDGKPSIIGTMLDITERKRAEELILREKTLSETIINSLPEVFYLRNDKGKFLRWNKNFESVTGFTTEEIEGLNAGNMLAEEDREAAGMAVEKISKEGYTTIEARVISKDGSKIPFLITATSLVYEGQQCVLGIAIDISARKKAEEELRSSEHKYKLLFDSNPQPMTMIAKDDLSIIAVNNAAANLYGYAQEQLLNMNAAVLRPVKDARQQTEIFRRDIRGSTDLGVIRHVKKDGTAISVQINAHDIVFEGRLVRLSLINDITEKLKVERTLQKSEANLKTIMDTTDTAYALLDRKLDVIAFNQMAVKFVKSQYNHAAAKGDHLADYFPEERFPQFKTYANEVLKGKNISYEINYPQPDGTVAWFYVRLFPITNDKNEIFGLMLALSDVTERKNNEDSLKAAYQMIQDHIDSIKDMAWKQSHLIRSPLANLKGLAAMLQDEPSDHEVLKNIHAELERLDKVIIEMAEDASNHNF